MSELKVGMKIRFKPSWALVDITGKVQKERGDWFICNNKVQGKLCKDKLGYKYSYWFNDNYSEDYELLCNEDINCKTCKNRLKCITGE
jgi:hypothetical protein